MQFAQRILLGERDTFLVTFREDRFWRYAVCPNAIRTNLRGEAWVKISMPALAAA